MPVGVGNAGRRPVGAAVLAVLLAGCAQSGGTSGQDGRAKPPPASASASTSASEGGSVGAEGSACALPVSFGLAARWEAEAVEGAGELAALLRQGPVTAVCEIDAKPAGHIGFLRVFTAEPGEDDARTVLEAFVAAEDGVDDARYTSFEAGGLAGVEAVYAYTSELLEETKQEHAFAVVTPDGPVVVQLGGMDTEEHRAMLPAYELARTTLRTA
ncbi:lipoprotein [Streptomyces sp. NPDC000348]|uniref:lipoprotein n=1 Tax=Streptomyces sp. NPDC000348 TaxID=3364538 RepID=UPI0036A052DE